MHLYGLLFCSLAIVVVTSAVAVCPPTYVGDNSEPQNNGHKRNNMGAILRRNGVIVKLCVFSLWPLSFLVGLTLLGAMGAGFQSRFLLPLLPATAVLGSVTVYVLYSYCLLLRPTDSILHMIVTSSISLFDVLLFVAVIHSCVYGMMFAPLFGDLDMNIVDMIDSMHENPLRILSSQDTWQQILQYLRHFGLPVDR